MKHLAEEWSPLPDDPIPLDKDGLQIYQAKQLYEEKLQQQEQEKGACRSNKSSVVVSEESVIEQQKDCVQERDSLLTRFERERFLRRPSQASNTLQIVIAA